MNLRVARTVIFSVAFSGLLTACVANETTPAASGLEDRSAGTAAAAPAPAASRELPSLVVTNEPPPEVIYRRGSRDTVLSSDVSPSMMSALHPQPVETLVTRKVAELNTDLSQQERATENAADRLKQLQDKNDAAAAKYYEIVALINTELQAGTTAGNPILVERWNVAQDRLRALAETASYLNGLSSDLTDLASRASFLQENVRAAYALSGAVKEDHQKLRVVEDNVNQNIVAINRLLTAVSDEINRRTSYLRSENLNLQTLSLAIAKGELYGQNLSNSLFRKASEEAQDVFGDDDNAAPQAQAERRRPLVIIRFDRANVVYEQALYSAVNQALEKYPGAKFDLVAVSSLQGNEAEKSLAATEARKNGEDVLRSLMQMGLPLERVNLSAANSKDVRNSEVHIYIQ